MLLTSLIESNFVKEGELIISNRPFDTTKGHICASKLNIKALTPMTNPETYKNSESVFMGNIKKTLFDQEKEYKILLITLTDNGGGG